MLTHAVLRCSEDSRQMANERPQGRLHTTDAGIICFVRKFAATHARALPATICVALFLYALCASAQPASAQPASAVPCPALTEVERLMKQQQWETATQTLRRLIAENPKCPDARYLLGYALLRANQPEASLKAYSEAAQLRLPSSDEFTAVASDYILLKAYTDAERWLLRAVQTTPVNSQAWYLLGRTQYNLDHNVAAVESFQHSLTILPEDPRSEYNLGLAYERLQKPDLARGAYLTAIHWGEVKNSPDAQPYLDLGVLTRSQGHAAEALPFLQKAAALSSHNPLIFQELGRTYGELNQVDNAITAFKTAITLAPSAEPPHFFLGRVYRAAGKTAEANEQFSIVQQLAGSKSTNATPNIDHAQ